MGKYVWYNHFGRLKKIMKFKAKNQDFEQYQAEISANKSDDEAAMISGRTWLHYSSRMEFLAIDRETFEHIENTKFKKVVGQALQFPRKYYKLGLPREVLGSNIYGIEFYWINRKELIDTLKLTPPTNDENYRLFVLIDTGNLPELISTNLNEIEILNFINSGKINLNPDSPVSLEKHDKLILDRVLSLIIKTGILLSINESKLMPLIQKDLPHKIKKGFRLSFDEALFSERRSQHLVSGHLRQLINERYYRGKWAKQELIGTRYTYVSSHFRGGKEKTTLENDRT